MVARAPMRMTSKVATSVSSRALVLGMTDANGIINAAELFAVAEACGYTYHQVRLCLARLVAEGLFTQTGRGQKAVFKATKTGLRTIEPETDFLRLAWAQDAGLAPWDGQWHLVAFSIDESQREARNAIRDYIVTVLGGGYVFDGLYVSAHHWEQLVLSVASDHGVSDRLLIGQSADLGFAGVDDPRALARQIWHLDDLAGQWQTFVKVYGPVVDAMGDADAEPSEALAMGVTVATEFGAIIYNDPLLPPELLPGTWPGKPARQLLIRATRHLQQVRTAKGLPALYQRFDRVMSDIAHGRIDADIARLRTY